MSYLLSLCLLYIGQPCNYRWLSYKIFLFLTFSVSLSQYGTWYKSYSPLVSMRTAYGAPNYDTPPPLPFVSLTTVCHAPRNIHWSVPHWILIRQEKCVLCIQYITIDYGETFHPVLSGNLAFICLWIKLFHSLLSPTSYFSSRFFCGKIKLHSYMFC